MTINRGGFRQRRGRGFTLIEVMISVAMVLLLIYGVTQVFKMSSDTVGANNAVATMVRDQRAAIATMKDDFRNCVNDSPMFVIASRVAYQFDGAGTGFKAGWRDAQAELQAYDKDPAKQFDQSGSAMADVSPSALSDRMPRLDRLGFFARNLYQRQTAPNDRVYSTVTSTDAYVWYGPVALVNRNPSTGADVVTYPQNQYAKDRILGRMAILLKSDVIDAEGPLVEKTTGDKLSPLDLDSKAYECTSDVARISLDGWRQKADGFFAGGPVDWYQPMLDVSATQQWWAYCRPTLVRPITSQRLSQTVSSFVPHCTQFIVEYAGDFLDQDANGDVIDAKQKWDPSNTTSPLEEDKASNRLKDAGAIDYVVDVIDGNPVRRIRWYGLPRDIDGDGRITIKDVVPLADVMATLPSAVTGGRQAPWEKELPPGMADYAAVSASNAKNFRYVCAWHNGAPPLIRVTMKLDDPTGRLQGGQWYEFVLSR